MRKTINITALLFFIWLILDAFQLHDKILYFLIMGEVPGTSIVLEPTTMLAIMSTLMGIVIFESLARHFDVVRKARRALLRVSDKRNRLPTRRFTRV